MIITVQSLWFWVGTQYYSSKQNYESLWSLYAIQLPVVNKQVLLKDQKEKVLSHCGLNSVHVWKQKFLLVEHQYEVVRVGENRMVSLDFFLLFYHSFTLHRLENRIQQGLY